MNSDWTPLPWWCIWPFRLVWAMLILVQFALNGVNNQSNDWGGLWMFVRGYERRKP
jgi:hypothetical protein